MNLHKITEHDGKQRVCDCGCDVFYNRRHSKKRNKKGNEWEELNYYVVKCNNCGKREDKVIQDWHKVTVTFV